MPYVTPIDCPRCEKPLIRKTGGRCPACGEVVTRHVARARLREKRIEQVVAILATAAVLALFLWAGGAGLVEGVAIYAVAGLGVWYWGKGTFWSATMTPERPDEPGPAGPGQAGQAEMDRQAEQDGQAEKDGQAAKDEQDGQDRQGR